MIGGEVSEQQKNMNLLSRMLGREGGGDSVLNQTKAVKSVHDEVGAKMARAEREQRKISKRILKAKKKKQR